MLKLILNTVMHGSSPQMRLSILVLLIGFLFLCSRCSKVSLCLCITDIKINELALDTSKKFESQGVKRQVRHATITAAWKHFISGSKVSFINALLRYPSFFTKMLDTLEKGLIYSLHSIKKNEWCFFAFDASLEMGDRIIYAVAFPQRSAKAITRLEKWFSNPICNNFNVELILNSQYHVILMPALTESIVRARHFGRGMRFAICNFATTADMRTNGFAQSIQSILATA